jgi:hypothetical protein
MSLLILSRCCGKYKHGLLSRVLFIRRFEKEWQTSRASPQDYTNAIHQRQTRFVNKRNLVLVSRFSGCKERVYKSARLLNNHLYSTPLADSRSETSALDASKDHGIIGEPKKSRPTGAKAALELTGHLESRIGEALGWRHRNSYPKKQSAQNSSEEFFFGHLFRSEKGEDWEGQGNTMTSQ